MTLPFGEKIRNPKKTITIFEFIPPEADTGNLAIRRSAAGLARSMAGFGPNLDAIYIPQIVDEGAAGMSVERPERVEARQYAAVLSQELNLHPNTEALITHPFPFTPVDKIETWIKETTGKYGVHNIVAVGPPLYITNLPGLSAMEALELMRRMSDSNREIVRGAIAMDTRRADGIEDEPYRMVQKAQSGADFFTTQLFYSAEGMISLLQDYRDESERQGVAPKRVILSVAPIPSKAVLRVIETLLGREVEKEMVDYIFSAATGRGIRSMELIETMIRQVFDYCYGNDLLVPLGISVGHITEGNFRFAFELLHTLPEISKDYITT